jgi:sarcosine oxidase, subunit beta
VTYDVAICGAGVIGASCAYHCARAGLRVLVLERAPAIGAGSTAHATGGFRAQFDTAIDVRLSLLARERLRAFADETGVDPGVAEVGYLWLATGEPELRALCAANSVQQQEGLTEARIIAPPEIAELNPHVALDGVIGAAWCPTDGVLRPLAILRGYLEAAQRLGADVRFGEPVVALERTGERITAVVTPGGRYATAIVIDAGGPWAAQIAALAGVALPIVPLRRQVAPTVATDALPATMPLTIWTSDGFHARVRDGRALLLLPTPGDPDDAWCDRVEPAWLDAIAALAAVRIPALGDVPLDRASAWAGFYELSPDRRAIVGFAAACPNLLLVNGSSGHGVMHAPALGVLAAELAAGRAPSLDLAALRPDRFAGDLPGLARPAQVGPRYL